MSSNIECPICMDDIEVNKNCVTTECGHCFHASCLMRNVALNGFSCPYCRAIMAEEPVEEDEEDEWSEISNEETDDEEYTLRGFRLFFNNVSGMEHDEDDVEDEIEDEEAIDLEQQQQREQEQVPRPSARFIADKLVEEGITMETIVKALLKDHDEYDADEEEFLRIDDELFGKLRIIISNYTPASPTQPEPVTAVEEPVIEQEQRQGQGLEADDAAQPKEYANVTVRRRFVAHN